MATIIDSHIHLWPKETANEECHAWMTPGMPLAKPHMLEDYCKVSSKAVKGVIYVETDVRYGSPSGNDVADWAKGPLDEIEFLRCMVEGEYGERDSKLLLGLVPWAPMDQSTETLEEYLRLAEQTAGPATWRRTKGFRFLLQAILDQTAFKQLVSSKHFIANLQLLGKRGFSFDVGVDQHSGGDWQLEAMAETMKKAHDGVPASEKVVFIVNHLCKPDFSNHASGIQRWSQAIATMAACSKTYMKLSGAFSELPPGFASPKDIAAHLKPWVERIFETFGPDRIMFGSDWPVCNVKGPRDEESWSSWREVVEVILTDHSYALRTNDTERIWSGTAAEAYQLC